MLKEALHMAIHDLQSDLVYGDFEICHVVAHEVLVFLLLQFQGF